MPAAPGEKNAGKDPATAGNVPYHTVGTTTSAQSAMATTGESQVKQWALEKTLEKTLEGSRERSKSLQRLKHTVQIMCIVAKATLS